MHGCNGDWHNHQQRGDAKANLRQHHASLSKRAPAPKKRKKA
jgi:hypothetical protein